MTSDTIWILVANASRARLFAANASSEDWQLVEELTHPESRTRPTLLYEQPENPNAGAKHKPSPENQPDARMDFEAERFAKELSKKLDQGFDAHTYRQLVIAAPPQFLGMLRGELSKRVQGVLLMDMRGDFTTEKPREVQERIPLRGEGEGAPA